MQLFTTAKKKEKKRIERERRLREREREKVDDFFSVRKELSMSR